MFEAGSFLRALDIYLVENVAQTTIALALVTALIHGLKIRDPSLKIRLYLLPIFLPLIAPPIYYMLFPGRSEMPVLKLDRLLALEKIIPYQQDGSLWGPILTLVIILALGLLLARAIVTILALIILPKHHRPLPIREKSGLQRTLSSIADKAGIRPPRILLSESHSGLVCSFALKGQGYLLVPSRWLEVSSPEVMKPTIAHEIAHLKRGDHRLLPLLRFIRWLLFFNPAVHVARALIIREAELASDQMALKLGIEPADYGEGLLRAWQEAPTCQAARGPGAKEIRERVEAVLTPAMAMDRPRWAVPGVATTLGVTLFFLC